MKKQPPAKTRIDHPLPPLYDEHSEVLILGSFPSPKTRESGFFYGHPQNRMWPVLARLFDEPVPGTVNEKRDFLLRHHIAMWDVLASCEIVGASDASISGEVPTDLLPIFEAAPIKAVFCAGGVSAKMYRKYHEERCGMPCFAMPSTSPANAAWSLDRLTESWAKVLEFIDEHATQQAGADKEN